MYSQGKFKPHGQVAPPAKQVEAASTPTEQGHGPAQSPHGGGSVEHVTKTHPGETQPHPVTGVHAFHGHHVGGGKHVSHTHHDGGNVETKQHPTAQDMHAAMQDALPDGDQSDPTDRDMRDGGQSFDESLGAVGGNSPEY